MKFWFDTEFIEDGRTIDLMSIGIVSEDERRYYAECEECDMSRASDWVKANVIPHLTGDKKPRAVIAEEIKAFMGDKPEIWAYYADYDWVALCQLYGTMMQLPKGWPMYCRDLKQWCDMLGNPKLPEQASSEHHALNDAIWTRGAYLWLKKIDAKAKMLAEGSAALSSELNAHAAKLAIAEKALERLIAAKDEKDANGETERYHELKQGAWEQARDALAEIRKP